MRSTSDRIQLTMLFVVGMILVCSPMAATILGKDIIHIGMLTITISLIAMVLNCLYIFLFDLNSIRLGLSQLYRPPRLRVLHAVLFELSLLLISLPIIVVWLDLSLWKAFITDIGFSLFAFVYGYQFNRSYDLLFPADEAQPL